MPHRRPVPIARVGFVGGGQLARMMVKAARRLGCWTLVLDPTPRSPAGQVSDEQIVGAFHDPDALRQLAERVDVVTLDLEDVDTASLRQLQAEGTTVRPDPALLAVLQDKLTQKQRFADAGFPTLPFVACPEPGPEAFEAFGYPLVQKARRGGYDGRGVAILRGPESLDRMLPVPSLLERFVADAREVSVLVARGVDGDVRSYPPTEMTFRAGDNVLDLLVSPARLPERLTDRCTELARAVVDELDGVGIFGVEFFIDRDDKAWINEIAPRPHNSGHHTFEACATDQFEQHLRAVLGLPLGSTEQFVPAALVNLLGAGTGRGAPVVEGLHEALAMPGVSVHLYGKREARPGRKMGHVTVVDRDRDVAMDRARAVRATLKIGAEES
jgi:5-(carboxyamino)imidazole ribonucleotide synthase